MTQRDKSPRSISPEDLKAIMLTLAQQALASVTPLEEAYLRDRNPVRVWDAILQIHYAAPTLGRPIEYPPWVLTYLYNAAVMIAGAAVTTPEPPVGDPIDANSSWFVGLTSEQRLRMVIEALGFSQGRGRSPLAQAHREYQNWLDQRAEKELIKEEGLTREAAAKRVSEGHGRRVADHARRSRRVRGKLGGES